MSVLWVPRIPVSRTPSSSGSRPRSPMGPWHGGRYTAGSAKAQLSRHMTEAREGDPRGHRADACESVRVTSNYLASGQQTPRRWLPAPRQHVAEHARRLPLRGSGIFVCALDGDHGRVGARDDRLAELEAEPAQREVGEQAPGDALGG